MNLSRQFSFFTPSRRRSSSAKLGLILSVCAFVASGCASVNNVKICQNWVSAVNSELEECGLTDPEAGYPLQSEEVCPADLNETKRSCQAYYDCLLQSAQCVEGEYIGDPNPACGAC